MAIPSIGLILLTLFVLVITGQLFYLLFFFCKGLISTNNSKNFKTNPPVSVIVIGRNEKENFTQFLPHLFAQDYPEFELIVVNDLSWDGTRSYIEKLQEQHPNLRLVNVPATDNKLSVGKKFGLTLGIKAAKYEHLIFTDADCKPATNQWIKEMAQGFTTDKTIVLGVGDYRLGQGFVAWLQQFEALQTALTYIGFAQSGIPYMGVGRNLAYTKSLFMDGKGFAGHLNVTSGDDDLFVNNRANSNNTSTVASYTGLTHSIPKISIRKWIEQKQRHFSTISHYKGKHQFLLGFNSFLQTLFWLLFFGLLVVGFQLVLVLALFGFRLLLYMIVHLIWAHKLQSIKTMILYPFGELLVFIVQTISFVTKSKRSRENW